ncbi:MAG: hypothetical protein M3O31_02150 [Acidobacteriota bacterium]|nr:hypothetical protein [Acidobacteriota bacterium]
MNDDRDQPFDSPIPPRRFVYRSANSETSASYPHRRATDTPRPFQGIPGQPSSRTQLLRFRVYLKVN